MTELKILKPASSIDNITELPTATLLEMLAAGLKGAADHMFQVSAIVVELERRGEDLSGLGSAMRKHLRLVATGSLLPEILVNYASRETILNQLAAMPIHEQKKILNDPTVTLMIGGEPKQMKLLAIPYGAVDQLFDSGRIRDNEEQAAFIQSRGKRKKVDSSARQLKARPDHKRGGITVGNAFVPKAEVLLALSELAGPLADVETLAEADIATGGFKLSKAEKERLRAQEIKSGLSEWQLVRTALRAVGMI